MTFNIQVKNIDELQMLCGGLDCAEREALDFVAHYTTGNPEDAELLDFWKTRAVFFFHMKKQILGHNIAYVHTTVENQPQ